jgi:two-component system LytT family response regulator
MKSDARVLIADDEPLARRVLRGHLSGVDWIAAVHEVGDGLAAIRAVDALRPDLLFLDVQMPGASGVAVAEQIAWRPAIVFTTAFDRYAVTAFEIGALDYLLKPFGRERVLAAVERARLTIAHDLPPIAARAAHLFSEVKAISRLFVKERGRMVAVPLERVERLEACDDYVAICADGRRHLLHARLHDLAERVDAARFLRVHRSHVVNLDFVAGLEPREGGRLTVVLASGTRVPASRAGAARLRDLVSRAAPAGARNLENPKEYVESADDDAGGMRRRGKHGRSAH